MPPPIRGVLSDHVLSLAQLVLIAVPEFFWAIVGVLLFASVLHWLPATGYAPIAEVRTSWGGRRI